MNRRRVVLASLTGAVLLTSSCTGSGATTTAPATSKSSASAPPPTTPPSPLPPITPQPPRSGPGSAQAAKERLCRRPPYPKLPRASAPPPNPVISEVEHQVETVRGLDFIHPVAVAPVTHGELVRGLNQYFDISYPKDLYRRRGLAWQTIGVVPPGTDLRHELHRLLSTGVIGYYDPLSRKLVFIGTDSPSPSERFTLAHELTHADDDQHFHLNRLIPLERHCDDEALMAATGAVEGSAVFFQFQVARQFFSAGDMASIAASGGSPPQDIPPFIQDLFVWPYEFGRVYIEALSQRGGLEAVNGALLHPPISTEQVIHPERYPGDVPEPVDIPQLAGKLGKGWRDLDVMDVGEAWLNYMVNPSLPIGIGDIDDPADGWDGGLYRAWTDGNHIAVVMETAWDSTEQLLSFAATAKQIVTGRDDAAVTGAHGHLLQLFASDPGTLDLLKQAAHIPSS